MKPAASDMFRELQHRCGLNGEGGTWWHRAALAAIDRGHFRLIPDRAGRDLYLARFWLSPLRLLADGVQDSGESLLLHWIVKPDDDGSLHDHPWDFRSRIVAGHYVEDQPFFANNPQSTVDWRRDVGDTIEHRATDLHRIVEVGVDTWTLVETGPKVRSWGFHPQGGRWTPWREYLGLAATTPEDA